MTVHRSLNQGFRGSVGIVAGFAVALSLAAPARAQSAGKGFLFQEPRWSFAVRGGFDRANANSDVFDFVIDGLTVDRSDFSSVNGSVELAYSVKPRLDIAFGLGYAASTTPSEFRRYVGTDDLPIRQKTTFVRVPYTVSMKAYFAERGQMVGSLAWIPDRFAPYVGVGGGAVRFKLEQLGEFVDEESPNLDIFRDRITSNGWAPIAHGLAGIDVALSPRWGVTTEARYSWSRGDLASGEGEFEGFNRIDLSGLSATIGLHVRF